MENYHSDDSEMSEFSLLDYESESDKDNSNAECSITEHEIDSDDELNTESENLSNVYIKENKSDILISPKLVNRHCFTNDKKSLNVYIKESKSDILISPKLVNRHSFNNNQNIIPLPKNMDRKNYYHNTDYDYDYDYDNDMSYFTILKFMCCGMVLPDKKYL